ncbi:MAG: hypothetical protein PHI34_09900 [Acidobacteriota bacterium]|nr:hypothetical protein [Acidobacteriota bacterium]
MDAIRAWLAETARKADRAPGLEEALLGGRFGRYARHRLRFFAGRTAVASLLHAVRILLAFRLFSSRDFGLILACEAAASLVSSFWWGSLEPMREDVRESFAAGKPRRAEALISASLGRSLRLALAAAAAGAAWPFIRLVSSGGLNPSDLFLLTILWRLAADLVLRCYHSGVYAVRRVYRPFWSLAGLEVLAFGCGLALWPLAGAWALPIASLVSAAMASTLSYIFSARAYRHLGLNPAFRLWPRDAHFRRRPGPLEGRDSGLAFALMRTDGVFLLALLAAGRRGTPAAAACVLAAAPLIRAGFDWTQLFYFDLKRLDLPLLHRLRDSFERRLALAFFPVGAAAWAGAMLIGVSFFGSLSPALAASAAAFFLIRSLASVLQMRAYARGAYGRIFGAGVFILAGAAAAVLRPQNGIRSFAAAGAGFLLASAWLAPRFKRDGGGPVRRLKTALSLPDWASSLRLVREPVAVGRARFGPGSPHRGLDEPEKWQEEDRWAHVRIAEAAARRLGRSGESSVAGPGRLIWYASPPAGDLGRSWLLAEGMGLLDRIESAGPFPDGTAAAAWLAGSGWLGAKAAPSGQDHAADRRALAARFLAAIPNGWVFGSGRPLPGWRLLPGQARRDIWRDALAFASGGPAGMAGDYDVTAALDYGSIGLVFAAPRDADPAARRRWRSEIKRRNLADLFRESSSGRE